jgi:hypothetical protein
MQSFLLLLSRVGRAAREWAVRAVAVLLILVGMVVFPLPIPVGLPMMVTGLALLISSSHAVAELVRSFRRRYPRVDARLRAVEPHIPKLLRAPLIKTDPLGQRKLSEATEEDPLVPDDDGPW